MKISWSTVSALHCLWYWPLESPILWLNRYWASACNRDPSSFPKLIGFIRFDKDLMCSSQKEISCFLRDATCNLLNRRNWKAHAYFSLRHWKAGKGLWTKQHIRNIHITVTCTCIWDSIFLTFPKMHPLRKFPRVFQSMFPLDCIAEKADTHIWQLYWWHNKLFYTLLTWV